MTEGPVFGAGRLHKKRGLPRDRFALVLSGLSMAAAATLLVAEPSTIVALCIGIVLLGLLVLSPGLFLCGTVAFHAALQSVLVEMSAFSIAGIDVNLSQIAVSVITGLLFARALVIRLPQEKGADLPTPILLHVPFVVWVVLSVAWSKSPEGAIASATRVVSCLLIQYVGYWFGKNNSKAVFPAIGLVAIIAGFSAIDLEFLGGGRLDTMSMGALRVAGSFGGPVATACIAFAGLPVFCYFWLAGKGSRFVRLFALLGFAAVGFVVLFTLTRTVIVGLAVFAFLFLFRHRALGRRGRKWRVLGIMGPVVLVIGFLFLAPDEYLAARTSDLPGFAAEGGLDPNIGSGRGMIWENYGRLLARSSPAELLAGHGQSTSREDLYQLIRLRKDPHNSYLEVLYDHGLAGLVLYAILLGAVIKSLRPSPQLSGEGRLVLVLWWSYFMAYALSTIMFNGYVDAVGPRWLTYLGVGYVYARYVRSSGSSAC